MTSADSSVPMGDGVWDGRSGAELAASWGVPRVEAHRTIGSTNDRAAELARAGTPRPTVVVAEEQTAGRGRRGDLWQSSAQAGIWMSLVLEAGQTFPQLPLVVGVACAGAIDKLLGATEPVVRVKWPNDLLLDDRKLGGILCETLPSGVVIGVGINVGVPGSGFLPEVEGIATALEVVNHNPIDRNQLAGAIVGAIMSILSAPAPFSAARNELRRRDALVGRRVDTEASGPGVARGIDPDGSLRLELPDGSIQAVVSGSVRLAATPPRG